MTVVHVPVRPSFDTSVTRAFGIQYPIIQGAMAWLSEAELVAAVSNEGGLGVLGAATMPVDEFEAHLLRTKALTDKPFGVNFPLVLGDYREHLKMVLSHGVRVIFMSAGSPKEYAPRIKEAGAICVQVVPNLKLAMSALKYGVDVIVLESYEAGGHVSPDGSTAITNIPNVVRRIDVPVIAAGGIVDGYSMAAAMCLGADGIQMGTRFLATKESNASAVYQQKILDAGERDVRVFSKDHHPKRALNTPVVERLLEMEQQGRPADEQRAYFGYGRAKKAAHESNHDEGVFYAGSGATNIDEVTTVRELFDQILAEYQQALGRAVGLVTPKSRPLSDSTEVPGTRVPARLVTSN